MKRSLKYLLAATILWTTTGVWAGELLVSTFLDTRPFKGLELELDGRIVGLTGELGEVSAELGDGLHTLRILKGEAALAEYDFTVQDGDSAEVTVTFTDFENDPEITIETFGADDASGAPGVLAGTIQSVDGTPVVAATVRIAALSVETQTDADGGFELEVPRGTYTVEFVHPDYNTVRREGLRVVANAGVATNITMLDKSTTTAGAAGDVEEVVVLGAYKPSENAADIEKFSVAITDAISIEDLLRFGDSDVAATLKRIVGVSVTGGRYAVVRGLDGRYIAATLNGALMPSTDPFRRDVQLDLFPSDILGGIEIQKTFSADMPGETTGGIIRISTRDVPEEYSQSLSLSLGYTTGVTGEDLATYEGGDTDWLGVDDGLRELPGSVRSATNGGLSFSICQVAGQQNCVSQDEGARLAKQLPNIYNTDTKTAAPNIGLGYALGDVFELAGGDLGVYGAVSYDQKSESRQDAFIDDLDQTSEYVKDKVNTALNAYLVAGYRADGGWELTSKTIVLRDTEDTTTIDVGVDSEDRNFTDVTLEWVERQFASQQFAGTHYLFGDHELTWRLGISQTDRYAPDRRGYTYLNNFLALSTVERSYSELTEDAYDLGIDYALPFSLTDMIYGNLKVGVLGNLRSRDVELVRIGIAGGSNVNDVSLNQDLETLLSAENFDNDVFRLRARSTTTDSYEADQDAVAGYVSLEANYGNDWTVVTGVRQDNYSVDLEFPNSRNASSELTSDELLPAFATIYRPWESVQLRFGYSGTVSRPNITELAPSRFFDENDRQFIGCPSCEPSTIDNFDLRAEYYYGDNDSVSIAVFYKDITKPLEVSVSDGSGSATDALTFRNNEGATLSGVELDASKSFLNWENFSLSLGGNIALIESEIELDDVGQRLEIDPKRDLQGQSPFLANMQLSLDHYPWAQKFTLVANYFDDRIDRVTRNQPSIYEAGRLAINLNYEKEFLNGSKVKFRVKNLLDEKTEYTQGGKVIESYKQGVELSLGYSISF